MTLDQERMNEVLFEEWMKNNAPFSSEDGKIFTDLKKIIGSDLSLLYQMNKMIVRGEGQVLDNNLGINFICQNDICTLKTNYGQLELHSDDFRRTIAALVDIYEEVYPLGSVVELRKEVFREVLPIDQIEDLFVVITYRFVPYTENSYIQYVGSLYPVGNLGVIKSDLHFTHKTVKNVLYKGYSDEKELAYLYEIKKSLIVEDNYHSTGFITAEDREQLEQLGNVNIKQ